MSKKIYAAFQDKAFWDSAQKTAISVRDGVLEYLGAEIGRTPAEKLFKVYRSPATIANAAVLMRDIPLTDEHVSTDHPVATPKGKVLTSKMIDLDRPELGARVGVLNTLHVDPDQQMLLDGGKRELSLGYTAILIDAAPGSGFDLEQIDILPHHLASVDAGRCGSVCSFIDHKRNEGNETMSKEKAAALKKVFLDAEGNPSMTEIVAIAQALPEALKALPVDKLAEVLPTLQEIVKAAGGTVKTEEETVKTVEDEGGNAEEVVKKTEVTDENGEPKKTEITDTKAFKDALNGAVQRHSAVIEKARKFLPETYKFADKATTQIMRDAVAVEHGKQAFSDNELEIAFKMLKPTQSQHRNFGDGAAVGKFTKLAEKEI